MAVMPASWQISWGTERAGWVSIALALIIVGGLITIYRRLQLIVRHLQGNR